MKKNTIFTIISIFIGIILSLFLGEIVSRVHYFGMDGFSWKKVNSFVPIGLSGYVKSCQSRKILYELKPNIDAYFKLTKFKTNSQNFRDKEYSISKPQNTKRGIVIGDSFTMGSGVAMENVYHSIVEEKLNERKDGINYELLNFGVGGYNLLNYLGVLESKSLKYEPDFIIIGFCGSNDFLIPHKRFYQGNYTPKKKVSFQFYLKKLMNQSIASKNHLNLSKRKIKEAEKKFIASVFNRFQDYSVKHNIPIIINYLSMSNDTKHPATIKALAEKHQLYFVESTGKFDEDDVEKYFIVKKLDAHPNGLANSIFANTLLSYQPFINMFN